MAFIVVRLTHFSSPLGWLCPQSFNGGLVSFWRVGGVGGRSAVRRVLFIWLKQASTGIFLAYLDNDFA